MNVVAPLRNYCGILDNKGNTIAEPNDANIDFSFAWDNREVVYEDKKVIVKIYNNKTRKWHVFDLDYLSMQLKSWIQELKIDQTNNSNNSTVSYSSLSFHVDRGYKTCRKCGARYTGGGSQCPTCAWS